jgi:hypothetical protein
MKIINRIISWVKNQVKNEKIQNPHDFGKALFIKEWQLEFPISGDIKSGFESRFPNLKIKSLDESLSVMILESDMIVPDGVEPGATVLVSAEGEPKHFISYKEVILHYEIIDRNISFRK